jgi:hypothetical protein
LRLRQHRLPENSVKSAEPSSANCTDQGDMGLALLAREQGGVVRTSLFARDDPVALTGAGTPPTIRAIIVMLLSQERSTSVEALTLMALGE